MMDSGIYRIIDANLNRAMEGVRVCEDIMRFSSNNEELTFQLKELRHGVFMAIKDIRKEHLNDMFSSRNIIDVGIRTSDTEKTREDISELFMANAQRGKESLRVLEEVLKLFDSDISQKFKKLRFSLYGIEKKAIEEISHIKGVR